MDAVKAHLHQIVQDGPYISIGMLDYFDASSMRMIYDFSVVGFDILPIMIGRHNGAPLAGQVPGNDDHISSDPDRHIDRSPVEIGGDAGQIVNEPRIHHKIHEQVLHPSPPTPADLKGICNADKMGLIFSHLVDDIPCVTAKSELMG